MPADPRERLRLSDLADVDVPNDLSSRSTMLNGGRCRLIMLHSSSSASTSLAVVTTSRPRVSATSRCSRALSAGLGVRGQALFERLRLADVEHLAPVVEHPVDPGPVRQSQNVALNQRGATRGHPRAHLTAVARRAAARRPDRTRPLFRSFHETLLSCFLSGEERQGPSTPSHQTGHALETGHALDIFGSGKELPTCAMACSPLRHTCPPVGQQWVKPEHDQGAQIPAQGSSTRVERVARGGRNCPRRAAAGGTM